MATEICRQASSKSKMGNKIRFETGHRNAEQNFNETVQHNIDTEEWNVYLNKLNGWLWKRKKRRFRSPELCFKNKCSVQLEIK
jgi:hypothetical protein